MKRGKTKKVLVKKVRKTKKAPMKKGKMKRVKKMESVANVLTNLLVMKIKHSGLRR